jgi:hypothetical protein
MHIPAILFLLLDLTFFSSSLPPQALYCPDEGREPAIRVRDNGRVEVLTKNLYEIPVPKKMRGIVKQEFDQLGEEHKV